MFIWISLRKVIQYLYPILRRNITAFLSTWRTQLSRLPPRPEAADHLWEDQASADKGKTPSVQRP